MDEPVEERKLCSFISESVPEAEDMDTRFNTVIPTRTFLEKIFLLHEEFQRENPRSLRMSRHLYDIEKIMDSSYGQDALKDSDLYYAIVEHRSVFNHMKGVDYSYHNHSSINFIPPTDLIDEWRKDYKLLEEHFLYINEPHLSFERLMERMNKLLERIRSFSRK